MILSLQLCCKIIKTNKKRVGVNVYLPNRIINPLNILPKDMEYISNDFVGQLGAYEIYKGKKRGHRMINLHLIFR